MPYASEAMRRSHQRASASHSCESAAGEIDRRVGNALRDRAASDQDGGKAMRCPHTGVWLFDRSFADHFMRDGGTALVKAHNDRIAGQGRLKLVSGETVKAVVAAV